MLFLWLSVLVVSARCAPYDSAIVNTGHSAQYRTDDGHGSYEFGYNEDHATGGTFRKEKGGPGYQVGSYGLRDADGRMRIVHYIADAHGFRVTMTTNEPGVDPLQHPASTSINTASAPVAASALSSSVQELPSLQPAYHNDADLFLNKPSNSVPYNHYIPAQEFYEPSPWNHHYYDARHYMSPSTTSLLRNWK